MEVNFGNLSKIKVESPKMGECDSLAAGGAGEGSSVAAPASPNANDRRLSMRSRLKVSSQQGSRQLLQVDLLREGSWKLLETDIIRYLCERR
jgi:hypothetical protein